MQKEKRLIFKADLHCHSTHSDGSLSPEQIVRLASEQGLKGLSITDHDCATAYEVALPFARSLDIELLTGVELSTILQETSIHILAYAFSPLSSINELCEVCGNRRKERNREILDLLAQKGMIITYEDLEEDPAASSIGRPQIAQALFKKGYVNSLKEAFDLYIGDGKSCWVLGTGLSTIECIEKIQLAGGLAVLAHPHLIKGQAALTQLLEMPFDGIEAYYALFSEKSNRKWIEIAEQKGWLITGGSDFHGNLKPNILLGSSWVDQQRFDHLISHQKEQFARFPS